MKKWRSLPSLLFSLAVVGCTSSAPPPTSVDPLEQNVLNAFELGADYLLDDALKTALTNFEAEDNLPGQWRINRLIALHALASNDIETAQRAARRLEQLTPLDVGNFNVTYETQLILGRAFDESQAYERALSAARAPVDRAVALSYLGNPTEALGYLDANSIDRPADRAFVLYRYGVAAESGAHLERAHYFYGLAGDPRGLADALVALARLARTAGNETAALNYADRAARTLLAIGDAERARSVQQWISN